MLWVVLDEAAAVFAEIICQEKRLPWGHLIKHFDSVAHILDPEGKVVWGLPLRAPLLQDTQRMKVERRLVTDHVDYHVDHLLFLVRYLMETVSR